MIWCANNNIFGNSAGKDIFHGFIGPASLWKLTIHYVDSPYPTTAAEVLMHCDVALTGRYSCGQMFSASLN